ncbi:MAG: phosphoglucosamine mutase, partial [bacterium]
MNALKIGISGVRGVVGETFTPHLVVQFTEAFATYAGRGEVYVCDDARPSGGMVRGAVIAGLLGAGCSPIDLEICPVPALQFAVARSRAAGGIAVSAGHNPEDWNALKFIRTDGIYLNANQSDELLDIYHSGEFDKAKWNEIKPLKRQTNAARNHIKAILASVDVARIRKAKFRVAVDASNGACSKPAAELLDALGCPAAAINDEPGEPFPHDPEPNQANMRSLRALSRAIGCDAGFMLDTAGERLGIVTDAGESLPEDHTLAICVAAQLERKPGLVVTNLSTSRVIDDIARAYRSQVVRTPIGQAYVAEAAMKRRAVIAGEGSGGVILPRVHYANDGLAAIAFILDHLARRKTRLSKIAASLPEYTTIKKNIPLDYTELFKAVQHARRAVETDIKKAALDLSDGIKIDWRDSWLHIRPSNTEAMIRLIAEARDG